MAFMFFCHELIDGEEQGERVGAADDLPSAVAIATAYYIAKQAAAASNTYAVAVFNDTGGVVAVIGKGVGA